jgi:glycosyltransferase involved in cell wall biosynthesis
MIIAVNTRFLLPDYLEGYGNFLYETFTRITRNNPSHQFIFIFDRPYDEKFIWDKNILPVVAGPPARHPLLWKWWYDIKIPMVLKKYKPDVFVSCDGFCSLRTKVPQCLVIHDLAFLHYPAGIKRAHLRYYKKYTPRFLKKAERIATVSTFSRDDIIKQYSVPAEKIDIIPNGVNENFRPLHEAGRRDVKNKYTEDKEYFLYAGSIHPRKNLINLLKAFSIFKKRQQSGMKLVLAGRLAWKYESFLGSLKSYKFREDVVMTGYLPLKELVRVMGAAYVLVYPSLWEGFGMPVTEAMRCEVPVITSVGSAMSEIAGESALYADPEDPGSIAEKMMLIYKDENLRKDLIAKGREAVAYYNWDKTAALLWNSIIAAAGVR